MNAAQRRIAEAIAKKVAEATLLRFWEDASKLLLPIVTESVKEFGLLTPDELDRATIKQWYLLSNVVKRGVEEVTGKVPLIKPCDEIQAVANRHGVILIL